MDSTLITFWFRENTHSLQPAAETAFTVLLIRSVSSTLIHTSDIRIRPTPAGNTPRMDTVHPSSPLEGLPQEVALEILKSMCNKKYGGLASLLNIRRVSKTTSHWIRSSPLELKKQLFASCVVHLNEKTFSRFTRTCKEISKVPITNFSLSFVSEWKKEDSEEWEVFLHRWAPHIKNITFTRNIRDPPSDQHLELLEKAAPSLESLRVPDSWIEGHWRLTFLVEEIMVRLPHVHLPQPCYEALTSYYQAPLYYRVLRRLFQSGAPNLKSLSLPVFIHNSESLDAVTQFIRMKNERPIKFTLFMSKSTPSGNYLKDSDFPAVKGLTNLITSVAASSSEIEVCDGVGYELFTLMRQLEVDETLKTLFYETVGTIGFWLPQIGGDPPKEANRVKYISCGYWQTPVDCNKILPRTIETMEMLTIGVSPSRFPVNLRRLEISGQSLFASYEDFRKSIFHRLSTDSPHLNALKITLPHPLTKEVLIPDLQGLRNLRHLKVSLKTGYSNPLEVKLLTRAEELIASVDAVISSVANLPLISFNLAISRGNMDELADGITVTNNQIQTILDGDAGQTLCFTSIDIAQQFDGAQKLQYRVRENLNAAMERGLEPRVHPNRMKILHHLNFDPYATN